MAGATENCSGQNMAELLKRLEVATSKLEALAQVQGLGGKACESASVAANSAAFVNAFEEIISGLVKPFVKLGSDIGGLVKEQSELFLKAMEAQLRFLTSASSMKKPEVSKLQEMFQETQKAIEQIVQIKETNRSHKQFNHLATVSEGIGFLSWPFTEPKPAPFATEMKESAQFWANRVIKDNKETDKTSVEWANKYVSIIAEVVDYIKKFHTTGVTWSKVDSPVKAESKAATTAPTQAPKPAATTPAASAAPARPNFFGELNKGESVTSGLKKVDKSQMTHKNPELRASSVVKASETKPAGSNKEVHVKGPAKVALEGNKWVVENQVGNSNIVLDQVELKHTIYIYNCVNSAIQVKGKVNAVTLDDCKKTALVLESVVSTVDVVNCKSIQLQVLNKTPTISIDKTDGIQVFVSKECLDVEILTSKSSEMNVSIPGATANDDYVERPLVEQFKTKIVGNSLVTVPVEHKA